MKFHKLTGIFPLMSAEEFGSLCADIKANGLTVPIQTYNGEIIDGRNRYNACQATNTPIRTLEWHGNGSLLNFVISLNLHRRHLDNAQRAMVAAELATLEQGQRQDRQTCRSTAVTQAEAAQLLNVSERSVRNAKTIIDDGVLNLQEKVRDGEMSLNAAVAIASQPKGKQIRLLKKKGSDKLVSIAQNLRVEQTLKKARSTHDVCLLCNSLDDVEEITEEIFLAFMKSAAAKLRKKKGGAFFARFLDANIEEIVEEAIADEIREDYQLILEAVDAGYQTEAEIIRYTELGKEIVQRELGHLISGKTLKTLPQGGKTDGARGARKTLYMRCEKTTAQSVPVDETVSQYLM